MVNPRPPVYNPAMKHSLRPWVFVLLGVLLRAEEPATPTMKFSWAAADDPAAAPYRQAGDRMIDRVGGSLMVEVERNIAAKGLDESLELMHLKNLALPAAVPGKPAVTAIKLTSLRVRQPKNAPDEADFAALDLVRTTLQSGEQPPKLLVQKIEQPNSPVEWRVYRPIAVQPKCLLCHGQTESLQPQVLQFLERHYPEDKASGYEAWEWRGLIRISYAPPAATPAPALKTD